MPAWGLRMPLVSVIIPTHNRAILLREAIESVLATRRADIELEVIISDDGSTDDTLRATQAYPVRYLRAAHPGGAAAARNAGIAAATGEYVAFLDDDDLWAPGNLVPQLQTFAEHPEYGAVFGRMILTDERRVPMSGASQRYRTRDDSVFERMLTQFPQIGAIVVRTDVARAVGPFDSSLANGEDWDWMLRIARTYPCGQVCEPAVLFRKRSSGDDRINWQRLFDTITVFKRHTRSAPLLRRLRYTRALWAHRGWFASAFLHDAHRYLQERKWRAALRCVAYALRASPPHLVIGLLRAPKHAWLSPRSRRSLSLSRTLSRTLSSRQQRFHLARRR